MAETVALIDYGAGNLHSVHNALAAAGAESVSVTADPDVVRSADRIVLPGVGSYRACAEGLRGVPGMTQALEERVVAGAAPFLGICAGMQLLATCGLEHIETAGLGWIAGDVRLIEQKDASIKVPHLGWNDVVLAKGAKGAKDHPVMAAGEAYFLHSYHFEVDNEADIAAMTDHGGRLVAAVARDNILGVQFHPEKSQAYGLGILGKFLERRP